MRVRKGEEFFFEVVSVCVSAKEERKNTAKARSSELCVCGGISCLKKGVFPVHSVAACVFSRSELFEGITTTTTTNSKDRRIKSDQISTHLLLPNHAKA